jgi:uncharacterized damage-inducible protein DinB
MTTCCHIVLMASYNRRMNIKLYEAAEKLPPQELAADRKAFFGSLIGTLNHIVVADTIWLKRFATPSSLDVPLFTDIGALFNRRKMLDETISQWAAALTEEDLSHVLHYASMKGVPAQKRFSSIIMHFFNHQTHHRGQATTLLSQAGVDVGVTDLIALIADEVDA